MGEGAQRGEGELTRDGDKRGRVRKEENKSDNKRIYWKQV